MADGLTIVNSEQTGLVKHSSDYGAPSVREVQTRASVANERQSDQEKRSLRRLNQALSNDQPLRDNVPRGFYINIEV